MEEDIKSSMIEMVETSKNLGVDQFLLNPPNSESKDNQNDNDNDSSST